MYVIGVLRNMKLFCQRTRRVRLKQLRQINTGCNRYQKMSVEITGLEKFLCELHKETSKKNSLEQNALYEDFRHSLLYTLKPHELKPITELLEEIIKRKSDLTDLEHLLNDKSIDRELLVAADSDRVQSLKVLQDLQKKFIDHLLIRDEVDSKDIIMELTAGVGGKEAMLFTQEMFDMYRNYATYKNWDCQVLEFDTVDLGGVRHAALSIAGKDVGKHFKFESGVHRVQRVPKTERTGRVHTSTMTVAVLHQSKEIEVSLQPKDLRIEAKHSSGAGGQHVNTTKSCIRIVHLPTGIFAECQIERSQQRNREYALRTLAARIYQRELTKRLEEEKSTRKSQVGIAARSDKVRTYDYSSKRITDHRLSKKYVFDSIETFMAGGVKLDNLIGELVHAASLEALHQYFMKYG